MQTQFLIMMVIAILAALIHVSIFVLESFLWTTPKTRKIFKRSEADALSSKGLAYNQGFYNLFLAIAIFVGLGMGPLGQILVDYAMASIAAAGIVLLTTGPGMLRSASFQLIPAILYFAFHFISF